MTDWTHRGVADIGYTHAFHAEMAPAALRLGLALQGLALPFAEGAPFAYCELGCGQGLTSTLLAALHPEGRFEAVDLLPRHVRGARALAAEAGLANLGFVEASFADWAAAGGPDFDVIALHGVWSWVGEAERALLARILRERLKPGGVAYLSYNCLPGWAADLPVRRLLRDRVAAGEGGLPERIERALDHLRRLARLGGYFDKVPGAAALVESLADKSHAYIAHEFLNQDWTCFWHADVAETLGGAGLSYGGSTGFLDALDLRLAPAAARALIEAEADPTARRGLLDTLSHRRLRRDLYVKEPRPGGVLAETRFALCQPRTIVPEILSTPLGEMDLPPARIAPLLALLDRPRRLAELPEGSLEPLLALCGLGLAAPVAAPTDQTGGFNRAVLARQRQGWELRQLAGFGTGLQVDLLDRLFLLAEQEGTDAPATAWSILKARGKRLRRDGAWLEGEDNLAELRRLHSDFLATRRDWYTAAGIGQGGEPCD